MAPKRNGQLWSVSLVSLLIRWGVGEPMLAPSSLGPA